MDESKYKFFNYGFWLSIFVSTLSLLGIWGLYIGAIPKIHYFKEQEGLTLYFFDGIKWIAVFLRIPAWTILLASLVLLILVLCWLVPYIRARIGKAIRALLFPYTLLTLTVLILAMTATWLYTYFTMDALWTKQSVYERAIEKLGLGQTTSEQLQKTQESIRQLKGLKMVEVDSPEQMSEMQINVSIDKYLQALETTPDAPMKEKLFATLLQFRFQISIDHAFSRRMLKQINTTTGQSFDDIAPAIDWLNDQAKTEAWEPLPLFILEYQPPDEF